jgi:hypothetical protein
MIHERRCSMAKHYVNEINALFEKVATIQEEDLSKLISIINNLDLSQQMEIHGDLSGRALNGLYLLRHKVSLSSHAKEHISWKYFNQRIKQSSGIISDSILKEIVNEYVSNKYLALESLIIEAIKQDNLSKDQLTRIESNFNSKAFKKEIFAYRCRDIVLGGGLLDESQVVELLSSRAYSTLELALENSAITRKGLEQFLEPVDSNADKKRKELLFKKARNLLGP